MPNIGPGYGYIALATILLYFIIAFSWRKLNYVWSAIVAIVIPFLYNLVLASIQASALGAPINMPKTVLFSNALQLIGAGIVFYFIRKKQASDKRLAVFIGIAGFVLLFIIIPWFVGLIAMPV